MKKIVFLLIAFGFVVVTSCEKEDNSRPATKEVAPNVINGNGEKKLPPYEGPE